MVLEDVSPCRIASADGHECDCRGHGHPDPLLPPVEDHHLIGGGGDEASSNNTFLFTHPSVCNLCMVHRGALSPYSPSSAPASCSSYSSSTTHSVAGNSGVCMTLSLPPSNICPTHFHRLTHIHLSQANKHCLLLCCTRARVRVCEIVCELAKAGRRELGNNTLKA